jgi:uncharacterized membrane protein YdjX (TVP38/TMEM64 family)
MVMLYLANLPFIRDKIYESTSVIEGLGIPGMVMMAILSGTLIAFSLPGIYADMAIAFTYNWVLAYVLIFSAKMVAAILCYGIANTLLSEERKNKILSTFTILKGVRELIRTEPIKYGLFIRLQNF